MHQRTTISRVNFECIAIATLPLIIYSFPSHLIEVWILVASELAMNRSVMENAERISPFNNGISHFFFCSGEPYLASTSILPVSGAAQFVALQLAQKDCSKEYFRSKSGHPSQFCHDSIFKIRKSSTFLVAFMEKQIPKTNGLGLLL